MGKTKDVRAAVEKELDFDRMVDSKKITVMNINGDVTLTGVVPSYPHVTVPDSVEATAEDGNIILAGTVATARSELPPKRPSPA